MAAIKPIRTKGDYEAARARIDALRDAEPGSVEDDELAVLGDLVALYESRHIRMEYPSPLAALKARMEQEGWSQRDLIPFIGSRAKVSEVLSGKRAITMSMARMLHEHLGIPADVLLREPGVVLDDPLAEIEWSRFPLKAMAKRGWIRDVPELSTRPEELVRDLIERAGGVAVADAALYRKNDQMRRNAKTDPYALQAWCWQVLATANESPPKVRYEPGAVMLDFLKQVAQLSQLEEGPRRAQESLEKRGIPLVIVPHLPKTYLDGAALQLGDGRPVIGLTLRYDRIDNFWFCLLHELAHVGRHMDNNEGEIFIDDLNLRQVEVGKEDPRETQADAWAEEALIPREVWETSSVRDLPTIMAVMNLATRLRIHPAIVAGRIRYERKNYRLLSQLVGTGEIRHQFGVATS